jgi:poly(A) polymerase
MSETIARSMGPSRAAPRAAARLLDDPVLARVLDALDRAGDETRIVGGALRDALIGRPVHEVDLATTAPPLLVMERAKAAGLRTIPTGLAHGTITVMADRKAFEVTSLREDIETDGRHAKVRFGRDFAADARRRDFTMNALFLGRDRQIYDYVGGFQDIETRKVRFIGEPERRIAEDYLRILRFFRFSAELGEGALDPAGLLAAIRAREGLCRLSRERIRTELFKLFRARRAAEIVTEMSHAGLLGPLIAGAPHPARLRRSLAIIGVSGRGDPMLALAALCIYVQEDAERLRERLRLSKAEFIRLDRLATVQAGLHGLETPPEAAQLRPLLYRHGRQACCDALTLTQAQARQSLDPAWAQARDFIGSAPIPSLSISGADLLARGLQEGRAIGHVMRILETRWIAAGLPQDAASQAGLLDEVLAGHLVAEEAAPPSAPGEI